MLDISEDYINFAQKRAEENGLHEFNTICRDMRDLPWNDKFDAVISMSTSFGFFSDSDNVKVLQKIYLALHSGGMLILDIDNRERIIAYFKEYYWEKTPKGFLMLQASLDLFQNRYKERIIRYDVHSRKMREHALSIRMYSCHEIISILQNIGFSIEHIYGGYDESEYSVDSPRLIVVAHKRSRQSSLEGIEYI